MAKKYIYLQGKVSWVKHIKPDSTFGEPKWSVQLHPNPDSLTIIKDLMTLKDGVSGIQNKLGRDEDGDFMNFSRFVEKTYKGKKQVFSPPVVVNADGSPMANVAIGNGSDGTIKLDYYTFDRVGKPKGSAVRWEGLRVDTLIPFVAKDDLVPQEFKKVKDLVEQPAQLF